MLSRFKKKKNLLCRGGACLTDFGGGDLAYLSQTRKRAKKFYLGADAVVKTVLCANWIDSWTNWK